EEELPHAVDVLPLLLRLVDTSFVVADDRAVPSGEGATPHFRLLETLREYGRERLAAAGHVADQVRRRHLDYSLGLVEAATAEPIGERQARALASLERAREDLWVALRWARDQGDAGTARRLSEAVAHLAGRLGAPAAVRAVTPLAFELRRLG